MSQYGGNCGGYIPNVMPTETYPNCSFLVDDAENDMGLGDNEFDYIHVRLLHSKRK
jgi:hypothetical protein